MRPHTYDRSKEVIGLVLYLVALLVILLNVVIVTEH